MPAGTAPRSRIATAGVARVVQAAICSASGSATCAWHGPLWMIAARNSPADSGRDQVVAHRHAARGLARDGDLAGIAAEVGDVVAHPAQRRLLIGEAVVADVARRAERRMRQEAQRAEPVVER